MSDLVGTDEIYVDMRNKWGFDLDVPINQPIAQLVVEERKCIAPIMYEFEGNEEGNWLRSTKWLDDEGLERMINFQREIFKPNDGVIFPSDEKLIFKKLKMFIE
jgi:hypothetical protein